MRKMALRREYEKGGFRSMRIIHCPKGGKVPEGYCRESCLNYPGKAEIDKRISPTKPKDAFPARKEI
jgi:hypothetical protein